MTNHPIIIEPATKAHVPRLTVNPLASRMAANSSELTNRIANRPVSAATPFSPTFARRGGRPHAAAEHVASTRPSDLPAHMVATVKEMNSPSDCHQLVDSTYFELSAVADDSDKTELNSDPIRSRLNRLVSAMSAGMMNRNNRNASALPSTVANASRSRSYSCSATSTTS